ncbi:hypothetical protein ACJX0J_014156, partial [Zea mays]
YMLVNKKRTPVREQSDYITYGATKETKIAEIPIIAALQAPQITVRTVFENPSYIGEILNYSSTDFWIWILLWLMDLSKLPCLKEINAPFTLSVYNIDKKGEKENIHSGSDKLLPGRIIVIISMKPLLLPFILTLKLAMPPDFQSIQLKQHVILSLTSMVLSVIVCDHIFAGEVLVIGLVYAYRGEIRIILVDEDLKFKKYGHIFSFLCLLPFKCVFLSKEYQIQYVNDLQSFISFIVFKLKKQKINCILLMIFPKLAVDNPEKLSDLG